MSRTLRKQTLSMRGEPVDFASLAAANPKQPTLGNTRTNVRGDVLGPQAQVLKTQEQVQAERAKQQARQQQVSQTLDVKKQLNAPDMSELQFPSVSDLVNQGQIPGATKTKKASAP